MAVFSKTLSVTAQANGNIAGLLFREEFDTLSLWDYNNPTVPGRWVPGATSTGSDPGQTDPSMSSYAVNPFYPPTASQTDIYTVSNSVLTIKCKATPSNLLSAVQNKPFLSGMLNSQHSFGFNRQYGYVEFKAKLPNNVPGFGGSMWLMPQDHSWPPEIDICEFGEPVSPGQTPTGAQYYHPVAIDNNQQEWPVGGLYFAEADQQWHTYAMDWQSTGLTFYRDGVVTSQGSPLIQELKQPMYLIFQTNSGTSTDFSNGYPTGVGLPASYQLDWVRWWDSRASMLAAGLS